MKTLNKGYEWQQEPVLPTITQSSEQLTDNGSDSNDLSNVSLRLLTFYIDKFRTQTFTLPNKNPSWSINLTNKAKCINTITINTTKCKTTAQISFCILKTTSFKNRKNTYYASSFSLTLPQSLYSLLAK